MTFADKLLAVANNRPKLYKKGALDYSPQETVSGEAIGITDISPIEHNMVVSVSTKNIIKFPYYNQSGTVSNGVTYTVNDDGSVTVNGATSSASSMFFLTVWSNESLLNDWFKDGETYVISGNSGNAQVILQAKSLSDNKDVYYYGNGKPFTIDKSTYKYCHLRIQVSANTTVDNVTIYPMIEKGTTVTGYAPFFAEDISTVKLYKGGKNLINNTLTSQTINGVEVTVNDDKSITVNGTATNYIFLTLCEIEAKEGTFFLSGCPTGGTTTTYSLYLYAQREDGTRHYIYDLGIGKVAEMEKGLKYQLRLFIGNGFTVNNLTFKPMLEVGTQATEYEPYIEPVTYDVSADGTVEGVKSLYPNTTLYTDTDGAVIDCTYYQDGRKVKDNLTEAIINLGGEI